MLGGALVALPTAAGAAVSAAPDPATNLTATANFDEVKLDWGGASTLGAETVVRGKVGTVAPTSRDDGFSVAPAELSIMPTATATDLDPGTPYSFAVFSCNGAECSAPATVTVNSYKIIGATVSPDRTTYGNDVTITGQVVDFMTGTPIDYADVRLVAHSLTTDEVYLVAEDYAREGNGRFKLAFAPPEKVDFVVFAFGDSSHLAGFGLTRQVSVSALALLKAASKKVKLGSDINMLGGAGPIVTSRAVVLQERVKKKWKTVLKKKTNKKGLVQFKFKPATKGKHVYRLSVAGTPGVSGATSKQVTVTVT